MNFKTSEMDIKRRQAKELYLRDGKSCSEIGSLLNVTRNTVSRWKKKERWDNLKKRANRIHETKLLAKLTKVDIIEDLDKRYIIGGLRGLANHAQSETVQLGAWKALGEHLGMFDKDVSNHDQDELVIDMGEHEKDHQDSVEETIRESEKKEGQVTTESVEEAQEQDAREHLTLDEQFVAKTEDAL